MEPSPTGTPRISPRAVPWILLGAVLIPALSQTLHTVVPHPTIVSGLLDQAVVYMPYALALLGIASPGMRSQP